MKQANEDESLDVQHRQIEGYGLMHGLVVDEVVVEEGVSGSLTLADAVELRRDHDIAAVQLGEQLALTGRSKKPCTAKNEATTKQSTEITRVTCEGPPHQP